MSTLLAAVEPARRPPAMPLSPGRVLVLGGGGALGSLLADAFERDGWEALRGARRARHGLGPEAVDLAHPGSVGRAIAGADLVVNTVPDPSLTAERVVLERGGALLSLVPLAADAVGDLRATTRRPLGTVLLNGGLAPGVTNLVAADLLARHPGADAVELVLTLSTAASGGRAGADHLRAGLAARRRHATATIPLPAPFGERRCVGLAEGERGWLGAGADGLEVRSYVCLAEPAAQRALLALNGLGLLRALPRAALGRSSGPTAAGPSRESVAHWVAVLGDGVRRGARTIECQGGYLGAAAAAGVFADALLGPSGPGPGAHLPEDAFTLDELAPRLWQAGIDLVEQAPHAAPPARSRSSPGRTSPLS